MARISPAEPASGRDPLVVTLPPERHAVTSDALRRLAGSNHLRRCSSRLAISSVVTSTRGPNEINRGGCGSPDSGVSQRVRWPPYAHEALWVNDIFAARWPRTYSARLAAAFRYGGRFEIGATRHPCLCVYSFFADAVVIAGLILGGGALVAGGRPSSSQSASLPSVGGLVAVLITGGVLSVASLIVVSSPCSQWLFRERPLEAVTAPSIAAIARRNQRVGVEFNQHLGKAQCRS